MASRRVAALLVMGAAASVAACAAILDVGDIYFDADASTDAGPPPDEAGGPVDAGIDSTLSPDAEPSRKCPTDCLPPAFPGWTGPTALYDGPLATAPRDCPTKNYTVSQLQGHRGLDAPPAQCSCGAGTPQGASCVATVRKYASLTDCNADTNGTSAVIVAPSAPCTLLTATTRVKPPAFDGGTCVYAPVVKTIPDASLQAADVACGLAMPVVCEGRDDCVAVPVPDFPFTRICLQHDGDELCPSADYALRFVVFAKIDDSRDCSPCAGAATGTCTAKYGLVSSACQGSPTDFNADGTCKDGTAGLDANGRAMGPSGVACVLDGGKPIGSATSSGPVTFCCNR